MNEHVIVYQVTQMPRVEKIFLMKVRRLFLKKFSEQFINLRTCNVHTIDEKVFPKSDKSIHKQFKFIKDARPRIIKINLNLKP
jgi:hypothetical protein